MKKSNKSSASKSSEGGVGRRNFLKNAAGGAMAAGAAALVAKPVASAAEAAATEPSPVVQVNSNQKYGSDFMVDVLKYLGVEYCAANTSANFLGLHESIINYGGNQGPEWLTACHEEHSVAMAQGYFKIEGKPMMILADATVGLMHASMAVYNSYADRVPVLLFLGNKLDVTERGGFTGGAHAAQDPAGLVRDFTKWDDSPVSLQHFAESAVRAYQIAMTPPQEPVAILVESVLADGVAPEGLRIPKLTLNAPPAGDATAVKEAARMLVEAENPLIVAGRVARTPEGIDLLVELADALQAQVWDQRQRMNFPTNNPLFTQRDSGADVILALDVRDHYALGHRGNAKTDARTIGISPVILNHKAVYGEIGRYAEADLSIPADPQATLPALIEEVKRLTTGDRRRVFEERGASHRATHLRVKEQARREAAVGWNSIPISTARLSAEMWNVMKDEDWSLVGKDSWISFWPTRLWDFTKPYHFIGEQGASGIGYAAPAAVGAALANKKYGRISVNIQCDGDLNYVSSVLWTAVHHQIPLLEVMHNNRGWHQEVMGLTRTCANRNRGIENAHIGTTLIEPHIDYAGLARSYGMYAEGPIENANDLGPALRRGIQRIKAGEPALIDVVTQPR